MVHVIAAVPGPKPGEKEEGSAGFTPLQVKYRVHPLAGKVQVLGSSSTGAGPGG